MFFVPKQNQPTIPPKYDVRTKKGSIPRNPLPDMFAPWVIDTGINEAMPSTKRSELSARHVLVNRKPDGSPNVRWDR